MDGTETRRAEGGGGALPSTLPREVLEAPKRTLFGKYILLEELGRGGSGAVYRAWQQDLGRFVAVKVLHEADAVEGERLLREARMAANLSHPNIVSIYEVGTHEGRPYLAMRLIRGTSLAKARLEVRRAVEVMRDVADAVAYAHENGVVHRDLKPHNLALDDEGRVWVMDFGLARATAGGSTLTLAGAIVGTPCYMSPEQASGLRCDERSDVYALGVTLYELVTGRVAFDADTLMRVLFKVLREEPAPVRSLNPKIPHEVEIIVGKAIEKEPARRYASARALREDLRRHLDGLPLLARPPGPMVRAQKWIKRHPALSAVGAVLLAALVALVGGGSAYVVELRRARRATQQQLAESMVAEAAALGLAGRWEHARRRYLEARAAYDRIGEVHPAPDLGLLDVHHHAPAPLWALAQHARPVRQVVFLPGGRQALSGAEDGTVALIDVVLGRALRGHLDQPEGQASLAVAADAQIYAAASRRSPVLRLYHVATGQRLREIAAGSPGVGAIAFAPGGGLVIGGQDGVIEIRDGSGARVRRFEAHRDPITALALSPDGQVLASGSDDTTIKLWDVASGAARATLTARQLGIRSLAFARDGATLASGSHDGVAAIWDPGTGQRRLVFRGHAAAVSALAFLPDGREVLSASTDGTLRGFEIDSGAPVSRVLLHAEGASAAALSPDGRFALSGGASGELRLYDLHARPAGFQHPPAVHAVAIAPGGRIGISGGHDGQARAWDLATGRRLRRYAHGAAVSALAARGGGLATGLVDGTVSLWDGERAARALTFHRTLVRALAVSPDGARLASADNEGQIALWDLARGKLERSVRAHAGPARALAFAGASLISAGADQRVLRWDLGRAELHPEQIALAPDPVLATALGPGVVLAGGSGREATLWDVATGAPRVRLAGHRAEIRGVALAGGLGLTASWDAAVKAWDLGSGRELHSFHWHHLRINAFAFDAGAAIGLSGSEDGEIKVWDLGLPTRHRALEAALAGARATLARAPDDGAALRTLADWYALRGVPDWAFELYQRAGRAGETISPLALGRVLWERNDLEGARRAFRAARAQGEAPADYLDQLEHLAP